MAPNDQSPSVKELPKAPKPSAEDVKIQYASSAAAGWLKSKELQPPR